jgi:hypothetical protein
MSSKETKVNWQQLQGGCTRTGLYAAISEKMPVVLIIINDWNDSSGSCRVTSG